MELTRETLHPPPADGPTHDQKDDIGTDLKLDDETLAAFTNPGGQRPMASTKLGRRAHSDNGDGTRDLLRQPREQVPQLDAAPRSHRAAHMKR